MILTRRTLVGASLAMPMLSKAQANFPEKLITIVVPFPAGGTTDVTARLMAQEMAKILGQPVVVENRPGANGNIGSLAVSKAAPDGYTLLMSGVGSNAVNHALYNNMGYDSRRDFSHVTMATSGPNVLIVHPSFPAKTLGEFIAHVKENKGKYNYASAGVGASGHMAMELLKVKAGLDIQHVPYRGGGPAIQDVLAGQVPMMFTNQDGPAGHIKAGTLRILGSASLTRNSLYPDTPTIAEQGFPGFAAVSWNGLSAPPNLPAALLAKLNDAAVKALKSDSIKEKLVVNGFVVEASTPENYTKLIGEEMTKWAEVAKAAGVVITEAK
jgi:tripartite-type tricarboxylate transporter receptor subunit TctC